MTLHFGLSLILAIAASLATAAFSVSVAEWLAPRFARAKTLLMRTRRKRLPAPLNGLTPLQSATVAIAVGIVLTVVLTFVLVVRLNGLTPA